MMVTGSWGGQAGQRRAARDGRCGMRRALWEWREREGVAKVTSEREGGRRLGSHILPPHFCNWNLKTKIPRFLSQFFFLATA